MEDFIQKTERQSTYCMHAQLLQSGHTLCDPMDCSPPGSSVHGILQARILEWVATPSSRTSSQARGQTHNSYVSYICKWVLHYCAISKTCIWKRIWLKLHQTTFLKFGKDRNTLLAKEVKEIVKKHTRVHSRCWWNALTVNVGRQFGTFLQI